MQFLATLKTFRDQKLQGPVSSYTYSLPRLWEKNPYLRQQNSMHNYYFRREASYNTPRPGCHLGSLWLVQTDPRPYPYLLNWFYISGPHQVHNHIVNGPAIAVDIDCEQSKDFRAPSLSNGASQHRERWSNVFEDRMCSHLEASTSSPLKQSILQNHESGSMVPPTERLWWASEGPGSMAQQTSFLKPPDFGRHRGPQQASFLEPPEFHHHIGSDLYGGHSERSVDEQETELDWRIYHNLSRTTYPGEFGDLGEYKLHFDDVFRPSEPLISNPDHADCA